MDLSIGSHHFHVGLAFAAGLALALVAALHFGGGGTLPLEAWLASGRQEVQTSGKLHAQLADSGAKVAAALHQVAHLAQDTATLRRTLHTVQLATDSLVRFADSARQAPLAASVRRLGEACGELVNNCEERVGLLAQALATEQGRTRLLLAGKAHADSVIAAGLKVGDTKHFRVAFLTLPKPPKWLAAAVGCGVPPRSMVGSWLSRAAFEVFE